MLKLIPAGALLVASAAWGLGLAAGVFGGVAAPMGAMAGEGVALDPHDEVGHLGSSWMYGGRGTVAFGERLELEAAAAYHSDHVTEYGSDFLAPGAEPTTLLPVTAGANFVLRGGASPAYVSAGAGYYRQKSAYVGLMYRQATPYLYRAEVTIRGPGFYVGGGFGLGAGPFTFAFEPRLHVVLNEGDHATTYDVNGATFEAESAKDYNDVYVDLLFAVNYKII
ncbi:MAG: hypothetical protein JSU81_03925 [Candidatus Coatesbacteria bacterium]|nr:MAG: hypothetical protein JSU81_03925 [Candidatus Coatesbacteria bacterium]